METRTSNILKDLMNNGSEFRLWEFGKCIVNLIKRIQQLIAPKGIYEVMDYESTLELQDTRGAQASFCKRETVRFLQDNVIAYQDQAWGDGEILMDYHCMPGKAVDYYRPGRKTYILISIQNVRNFGDRDDFFINWRMKNCFLRTRELWETSADHPTRHMKINVIFPATRKPERVYLIEDSKQRAKLLTSEEFSQLTDNRWLVHWEINKPRQHERYNIQWDW